MYPRISSARVIDNVGERRRTSGEGDWVLDIVGR